MTGTAEIADLNQAQCLQLLGADGLGRVVFTTASMPAVTPVRYHLDGNEVIFRVPPDGPLAKATRNAVVGFQADDIDPTTHTGWSVLGVGLAYEITDPNRRADLATSPTTHIVAVPLQQLTGHRVTLGHVGGNLATPHAGSPVATQ